MQEQHNLPGLSNQSRRQKLPRAGQSTSREKVRLGVVRLFSFCFLAKYRGIPVVVKGFKERKNTSAEKKRDLERRRRTKHVPHKGWETSLSDGRLSESSLRHFYSFVQFKI